MTGLLGLVLMLAGFGVLIGYAQQQVTNARVTVSTSPYQTPDADVLQRARARAITGSIVTSLSTGLPTHPQHWTHFSTDPTGDYSYRSHDAPYPLIVQMPAPRFIAPTAEPFAAGLGIVVGTLFLAARRWRPRVAPRPLARVLRSSVLITPASGYPCR